MPGALHGFRVLDCSQIIAGPLCCSLLAEMGADVIKVEPLEGEPWRITSELIPKESRPFIVENRSKRDLAIDLKRPEAAPVRERLIRRADVLLTNYRPGVAKTLGLDYESAKQLRPDIIYCENTAFGNRGPHAQRRGYDIIAQAMSGLVTTNAHLNEQGIPLISPTAIADRVTACVMAWGITAALLHRVQTGEGQRVDASLLLSALFVQASFREITALDADPREEWLQQLAALRARGASMAEMLEARRASQPERLGNVYYRIYQTKDGYLAVGCLGPEPRKRFQQALGIEDPRYQPGFAGDRAALAREGQRLVAYCEARFRERTTQEWMEYLDSRDIACGPVSFTDELWDDPQVLANDYIAEYEHTLLGPMRGPVTPVRMSGSPTEVQRASPALGEHNDEILAELSFSAGEIARLREQGVIL
jgi:crotonobetainyl-CoA:carnitine CoA-transferase CaiB-like acyl-CoA transferase